MPQWEVSVSSEKVSEEFVDDEFFLHWHYGTRGRWRDRGERGQRRRKTYFILT